MLLLLLLLWRSLSPQHGRCCGLNDSSSTCCFSILSPTCCFVQNPLVDLLLPHPFAGWLLLWIFFDKTSCSNSLLSLARQRRDGLCCLLWIAQGTMSTCCRYFATFPGSSKESELVLAFSYLLSSRPHSRDVDNRLFSACSCSSPAAKSVNFFSQSAAMALLVQYKSILWP